MFSVCVCAFFCVCVQIEVLRRADHPPKESYRLCMIQKKNRNETESFMEVGLGHCCCSANEKKITDGRTPWTSDQPVSRPLHKHRTTQTQNRHIHTPNIYALNGIRTYDPSVRESEDSSCLRTRCYCNWRKYYYYWGKTTEMDSRIQGHCVSVTLSTY
jgi:hypothetical protein